MNPENARPDEEPCDEGGADQSVGGAGDEARDLRERLQRKAAELENFRKQTERRMADQRRFVTVDLLRALLPVVDNFNAAMAAAETGQSPETVLVGVRMIHEMLMKLLDEQGLVGIATIGERFDPELHEALSQLPSLDVEPGTIVEEIQRGWRLKDLVVRHARVVVATAPPETDTNDQSKES